MVTIDLRDQVPPPRAGQSWALRAFRRSPVQDPCVRILQRVTIADLVALCSALALGMGLHMQDPSAWTLLTVVMWPIALLSAGAYDRKRLRTHALTYSTLASATSRVVVATVVAGLLVEAVNVRQSFKFTMLLLLTTLIGRFVVSRSVARSRRAGDLRIPVLARGRAADLQAFVAMLEREAPSTYSVVAVQCTDRGPLDDVKGPIRVPSSVDPVVASVNNGVAAMVIVGPADMPSTELRRTIWGCEGKGIETLILPIVEPVAAPTVRSVNQRGLPSLVFQGPNRRLFAVKQIADRLLAAFGLVLLLPLFPLIALWIRVDSSGPVLFRQTRVGRDGRRFTMLKFRTMCADAEDRKAALAELNAHAGGTLFKIQGDPRITRPGRFLRKFSLDEIPQLVNVVRGDMSLVGPRPPLPEEVANYPVDSMRRFAVKPGLTGLWQVSGRSGLDAVDSARLDTQYVEHWSFGLDMWILARTAKVVVTGEGAY